MAWCWPHHTGSRMSISFAVAAVDAGLQSPFEQLTDAFARETGMIAPGCSDPAGSDFQSYDERYDAWSRWLAKRRADTMHSKLRYLRSSSAIAA